MSLMLLGGLCATAAAAEAGARTQQETARTLMVLGDSISAAMGIQREAGWVALLEERLAERSEPWRLVNASFGGETTGGGLARLPQLLERHDPEIVLIELGGNDALRGYPLDTIRDNLDGLVRKAGDSGAEVIVAGMDIPPNYDPGNTGAFRALFREVARAHDAELIPFLLEEVALEPGMMQRDGIHPTAAAQPLILETAWPAIEAALERVSGG